MSVDATRWAWQQELKATDKLLLLSLADRAGEDHTAWPSYERLARDTNLNRKTVAVALKRLEASGLIVRTRRYQTSVIYTLVGVADRYSSTKSGTTKNGTAISTENGTTVVPKTGLTIVPKTVLEPINEPNNEPINKNTSSSGDDGDERIWAGFFIFWDEYPKKVGKKDAIKAWNKLRPTGDLINRVLTNISARKMAGQEKQFWPNPATYLNGERWEDEIIHQEKSNGTRKQNSKRLESLNGESNHDWRDPNNTRCGNH